MKLTVLSPEKNILEAEVVSVELPGSKGRFVVLKDHAPLLTILSAGNVRYELAGSGSEGVLEIGGGFAEVCDNEVCVCVG